MRALAIFCSVVLSVITGLIILTEGVPSEGRYLALTLLMLSIPLLSAVVFGRAQRARQRPSTDAHGSSGVAKRAAVLGNLALLGGSCWASVAQYPYPEGNSVIPFVLLAIGAPLLNLTALLREGRKAIKTSPQGAVGVERG